MWNIYWALVIVYRWKGRSPWQIKNNLEILKQGVEVWNKWREKNPDVKVDFEWCQSF